MTATTKTLVKPLGPRPSERVVEALIEEARRRHRRRRRSIMLALGFLLAGISAAVGLTMGGDDRSPVPTKVNQSPRFVPPTTTRGGRTTMAIRLPDGRGFSLSYPQSLDLARFHLTAAGQINWPVTSGRYSCCSEAAAPYYGTVASTFAGKPLATYRGVHGSTVSYFSGAQVKLQNLYEPGYDYLVFTFGPWVVPVLDIRHTSYYTARATDSERATWARSFDAHLTKGGYLVFAPGAPLHVFRGRMDIVLQGNDNSLEIGGPQTCSATQGAPQVIPLGRAWCDPSAGVHLSVTGQSKFVDLASSGLAIRPLAPVH